MAQNSKDTIIEILGAIGGLAFITALFLVPAMLTSKNTDKPLQAQETSQTPAAEPPQTTDNGYQDTHGSDACTYDCSGHEAGYEYAKDNDICDTEYSDGNSESFNEGVIAWAEDNC